MHINGKLVNFKVFFAKHSTKSEWVKQPKKDVVREQTSVRKRHSKRTN
jgi:hypothetical protein